MDVGVGEPLTPNPMHQVRSFIRSRYNTCLAKDLSAAIVRKVAVIANLTKWLPTIVVRLKPRQGTLGPLHYELGAAMIERM